LFASGRPRPQKGSLEVRLSRKRGRVVLAATPVLQEVTADELRVSVFRANLGRSVQADSIAVHHAAKELRAARLEHRAAPVINTEWSKTASLSSAARNAWRRHRWHLIVGKRSHVLTESRPSTVAPSVRRLDDLGRSKTEEGLEVRNATAVEVDMTEQAPTSRAHEQSRVVAPMSDSQRDDGRRHNGSGSRYRPSSLASRLPQYSGTTIRGLRVQRGRSPVAHGMGVTEPQVRRLPSMRPSRQPAQ